MTNIPSHWNNYIAVDNVDATVTRALELGGKISLPTMDVMQAGRMADIEDSTGAHIELWQAKKHIGAEIVNTIGAMDWNELYTLDLEKSKEFYGKLLGWTFDSEDSVYTIILNKGIMNGGILQLTKEMDCMQQGWLQYFTVSSSEDTIKKMTELGGKVLLSSTIPQGEIALISETTGAMCMTIESAQKPDEWIE